MMFKAISFLLSASLLVSVPVGAAAQSVLISDQSRLADFAPHIEYNLRGMSQLRDAELACFEQADPEAQIADWDDVVGRILATLLVNGFPSDMTERVRTALETRGDIDCENPLVDRVWSLGAYMGVDWPVIGEQLLSGYQIELLDTAPDPQAFGAISAALLAIKDKMERSIDCEMTSRPFGQSTGFFVRHWYAALDAAERRLKSLGYPTGPIEALIAEMHLAPFQYYDLNERLALSERCFAARDEFYPLVLLSREDTIALLTAVIDQTD